MSESKIKILLMDDEPELRASVVKGLELEGYENISQANNGQEAKEILGQKKFDCLKIKIDNDKGLKLLGKMNLVIHCHHYNSRLQRTIEQNEKVNGKVIIRDTAAQVYYNLLNSLDNGPSLEQKTDLACQLYSFLGFGTLDFSQINKDLIISTNSHYVEGWNCGSIHVEGKVCRMTEGYLKAALKYITDENYDVTEYECMNEKKEACRFKLSKSDGSFDFNYKKEQVDTTKWSYKDEINSGIEKDKIIEAVSHMPLAGNNEGLIPAFNVYLAHTPQDFYNLICIKFIEEMDKVGLKELAEDMLVEDAEHCALNTFGGILNSEEWKALIAPMVTKKEDEIFGLIAVANALGWGKINITDHKAFKTLSLESINGYESYGYLELVGRSKTPKCFMLKGVASGLMALVYEEGELEDRHGAYGTSEECCTVKGDQRCALKVSCS